VKEKLLQIIEKEQVNDIIPFLQSLTVEERKKLSTTIKQNIKDCTTYKNGNGLQGSNNQFIILSIAAFVCFDFNEYKRNLIQVSYLNSGFIKFHEYTQKKLMQQIRIDDILEWHQPEWMSEFINNKRTNNELHDFTYEEIMRWSKKGYITLSPELIAATLQSHPFLHVEQKNNFRYLMRPERLLEHTETLSEHIWQLFSYPTNIHYDMYYGLENEDDNWNKIFRQLAAEGHLDRSRLLKECLLASRHPEFKKPQVNWFTDLFNDLQPSTGELLSLQNELIQSLTVTESKPVNNSLNYIKEICTNPAFDLSGFLEIAPVLLGSSVKAILNNTLAISEKLLKAYPGCRQAICAILSGGFIHTDESVQKKLAKLLATFGEKEHLNTQLSVYSDQILSSVRPLLADFLDVQDEEEPFVRQIPDMQIQAPLPHLRPDNKIPRLTQFDDFLFFAGQIFENNEPWHIFMLPVYIQQFHAELTPDRLIQLEPVFKQAAKCIDVWNPRIGLTDRTFAAFLLSYGRMLDARFPGTSPYLEKLKKENTLQISTWRNQIGNMELYPFYFILLKTLDNLRAGTSAELLSTPTHAPLWIDPEILVRRLICYQQQGLTPNSFDMQLAILRSVPENTEAVLRLASKELTGELHDLMVYLFNPDDTTPSRVEQPAWWMCAAISKHPHIVPAQTNDWGYNSIPLEYLTANFKWETHGNEFDFTELTIKLPEYPIKNPLEKTFLPEYYCAMSQSRYLWAGDVARLVSSIPYNSDTIIAHFINHIRNYNMMDSTEKASIISALRAFIDLRLPLSGMGYLLLSLSLFAPDKEIKDYGVSLWMEQVEQGTMDNPQLARTIARLLHTPWLPLKRFIDQLETNMLNISTLHNKALEELLGSFFTAIGQKKLTNLKKLKEIYSELQAINNV